jgi:hypothetical protein
MKAQLLASSTIALTLFGSTIVNPKNIAIAGRIEPKPVQCYFFKGETLALQNTCTYEGWSWTGGGGTSLTWEDGVVSQIQFGLQGRGTKVCSDGERAIDGKCGKLYDRSPITLKRISNGTESAISCVQLAKKSICWKF